MLFGDKESVIKTVERIEQTAKLVGAIVFSDNVLTSVEDMLATDKILKSRVSEGKNVLIGPYAPQIPGENSRIYYPNAIGIWQHEQGKD